MTQDVGPFDLTGQVAVVTGGSRGLGAAISRGLAAAGAHVVIVSRNLESCQTLAAEIEAESGRPADAISCHVGKWQDVQELHDEVYKRHSRVDVIVNNAAISPKYETIFDITEEMWDKVFAVNLKGPFRLSALFGQSMQRDGGGSIINISSGAGVRPLRHVLPYAAAKAGLNNMTLCLSQVLGPNVRVNCIVSGRFKTDMSKHWDMEKIEKDVSQYGLQRIAEPSEMVGTILYLASAASSYTTGALLPVDGGYLARS